MSHLPEQNRLKNRPAPLIFSDVFFDIIIKIFIYIIHNFNLLVIVLHTIPYIQIAKI